MKKKQWVSILSQSDDGKTFRISIPSSKCVVEYITSEGEKTKVVGKNIHITKRNQRLVLVMDKLRAEQTDSTYKEEIPVSGVLSAKVWMFDE